MKTLDKIEIRRPMKDGIVLNSGEFYKIISGNGDLFPDWYYYYTVRLSPWDNEKYRGLDNNNAHVCRHLKTI